MDYGIWVQALLGTLEPLLSSGVDVLTMCFHLNGTLYEIYKIFHYFDIPYSNTRSNWNIKMIYT